MVLRRPSVPQRKRVFLGCEGESERSYVALLARLLEQRHRRVHFDAVLLGGGDPLAMVEKSVSHHRRRSARGEYVYRAILLDSDTLGHAPDRDEQAARLALAHGFDLIWQKPCHEAFLLLHLAEVTASRPQTTADANRALVRLWPTYEKALPAARLGRRIDRLAILRAGAVNEGLGRLLQSIDFGDEAWPRSLWANP